MLGAVGSDVDPGMRAGRGRSPTCSPPNDPRSECSRDDRTPADYTRQPDNPASPDSPVKGRDARDLQLPPAWGRGGRSSLLPRPRAPGGRPARVERPGLLGRPGPGGARRAARARGPETRLRGPSQRVLTSCQRTLTPSAPTFSL